MKIYTKTGDKGTTALFGGSRVDKDSLKVEAYGTIDEVTAFVGLAYAEITDNVQREELESIQKKLFVLGAELASDERGMEFLKEKINNEDIDYLEALTDKYMNLSGPFRGFVTPGKNKTSALLHVARTVVRRAERRVYTLSKEENIRNELKMYINRLSDTLYAMARYEEER